MESIEYAEYELSELFTVKKIISFHYHEWHRDFVFPGEKHNYWEVSYIDKGEVEINAYHRQFQLKQGDLWICKPGTFSAVKSTNNTAPNVVNFAFHCESSSSWLLHLIENKIVQLTSEERKLISELVNEAFDAFDPPIDTTTAYIHTLNRRQDAAPGCEQMIKIGIEQLLIRLIRRYKQSTRFKAGLSTAAKENRDYHLLQKITEYMNAHLTDVMSMEQLCQHFHVSETYLKNLFNEKIGSGMRQYIIRLKMERAKMVIREEHYNITQIAELLGYGSVHYFSRQFKKEFDMSPTEYARSIKAHHFVPSKQLVISEPNDDPMLDKHKFTSCTCHELDPGL